MIFFSISFQRMSPLGSGESMASIKGRLRKPSAKAMAAAETTGGVVAVSPRPSSSTTSPVVRRSILSLQYAVAETVVNDEEVPEDHILARDESITIEMIGLAEWKAKRRARKQSVSMIDTNLPPTPPKVEEGGPVALISPSSAGDVTTDVSPVHVEDGDMLGDSHSEDSSHKVQPEVKRKRGRPFKGQEKPIEERLMIETSKIRRLIDDVIRKGGDNEFFIRLRKIASDLDEVLESGSVTVVQQHGELDEVISSNPIIDVPQQVDTEANVTMQPVE